MRDTERPRSLRRLITLRASVIGNMYERHRAMEFRKFLQQIDDTIPKELELHLILDNYATHKTPLIQRWLARHPRFHVHFTPTHSSWLNLVERWFALLTERALRRGVHKSVHELQSAIREFLAAQRESAAVQVDEERRRNP